MVREPTDSSSGQAESCGDSRLSRLGNSERKFPARTRIIQKTQESGRSNLPGIFTGEVGNAQFLNGKREESFSSFSGAVASAAAAAATASDTNKFRATYNQEQEQRRERGNLTEGEGTLRRGEGNSAGRRSRHKLVQLGDILFDTHNQFRGGREEGEHLVRPVVVSLLDGGDEVLLRHHLQQHSSSQKKQVDTSFFFFVGIFSVVFLGGGFLFEVGAEKASARAAHHSLSRLCCASIPMGSSSASALNPL